MLDFALKTYISLLGILKKQGFSFLSFEEFVIRKESKFIILRHDVDLMPQNALSMAKIESSEGIKASYHFRIVGESNNQECIKRIVDLGHELCYHYEDLDIVAKDFKTHNRKSIEQTREDFLFKSAFKNFNNNLVYFRQFYPVKIISMHGSPKSKYDNRDLWRHFNYKDCGIICEPYFDIDYSKVLYLTDTSRRWNGEKFNLRDKVVSGFGSTKGDPLIEKFNFSSTSDIIHAAQNNELPDHIIINTHPQRWTDSPIPWAKELVWQNMKNVGKYFLVKVRN